MFIYRRAAGRRAGPDASMSGCGPPTFSVAGTPLVCRTDTPMEAGAESDSSPWMSSFSAPSKLATSARRLPISSAKMRSE